MCYSEEGSGLHISLFRLPSRRQGKQKHFTSPTLSFSSNINLMHDWLHLCALWYLVRRAAQPPPLLSEAFQRGGFLDEGSPRNSRAASSGADRGWDPIKGRSYAPRMGLSLRTGGRREEGRKGGREQGPLCVYRFRAALPSRFPHSRCGAVSGSFGETPVPKL